ncbi:MAG: helix-turn-helix transcriptional regulator [Bacteroidales bacterium]|nr:helix-turn-helix transcriptional regulator [Bacteroidales bacterium]
MVERLKFYIETQGMIASQFADAIGMPRSSFSQLLTGRNKSISDATIGKIHAAFPGLSISWLLFGEGEMLTDSTHSHEDISSQQSQLSIFGENEIFATDPDVGTKYAQEINVEKSPAPQPSTDTHLIGEPSMPFYKAQYTPQANNKRITHIVVYYNDNTFETLRPE